MSVRRSITLTGLVLLFAGLFPGHSAQYGWEEADAGHPVKIGLMLSRMDQLAAVHAARLAVERANREGGFGGRPFELVVRSSEGPWGAGSKESVGLVFEDEVVAMMGSLDGRNAHLAEQVVAKTRVLMLSTWATEMTLSQAFVPWYCRCLPNDDQQAEALIAEIYGRQGLAKVGVLVGDDYDARLAVNSFIRIVAARKIDAPRILRVQSGESLREGLSDLDRAGTRALVLFGSPGMAADVKKLMDRLDMDQPLYATLTTGDDRMEGDPGWSVLEGITMISPGHWFSAEGRAFIEDFREIHGYAPGAAAAYAFDGMNMIIEGIRKFGEDREKIRDHFPAMVYQGGVTGTVRFDEQGNRVGIPGLLIISNGKPQEL